MTNRATGSDVTRKGFPRVRLCTTGSWGLLPFFRVFSNMLCSTPRPRFFLFSFFLFFFLVFFPCFYFLFFIYFFFVQQYGKMKCFYNVTQVTLHFKRWISTLWLLMLLLEVEEGGCGDCSAPLGLV